MRAEEWRTRVSALAQRHLHAPGPSDVALVDLHDLMLACPSNDLRAYEVIDEDVLDKEANLREEEMLEGRFGWSVFDVDDTNACLFALAVQIRALDLFLATTGQRHEGAPDDPNREWLTTDRRSFVVPRRHARPFVGHGGTGKSYHRRGTRHHRILPTNVHGFDVELVWHGALASADARRGYAAALFPNFSLRTARQGDRFRGVAIDCPDHDVIVQRQIERALSEGCSILVWPELTIRPNGVDAIVHRLRSAVRGRDGRVPPQLVVPGSWHVGAEDGSTVNESIVLDGYGRRLTSIRKMMTFVDADEGREDIVPGRTLRILVSDDHLVAFAICRDFCERSVEIPFKELDVDLVIVPSMGDVLTLSEHQDTAQHVSARYGARTFVVQQAVKDARPDLIGYVLPAPKRPKSSTPSRLGTADDFRIHLPD